MKCLVEDKQWFSTWKDFDAKGQLAMSRNIFVCQYGEVLVESNG